MIDNSKKIVSVITINLNDRLGLQRTVESVKDQKNNLVEHIIIDGGSTDGSLEFIKENASWFSYSVSEPDKGVYDAQNKGIKKANGEYLLFLNSGDSFYSADVINKFIDFVKDKSSKLIYGNSLIVKMNGLTENLIPSNKLTMEFWYRNTLNHQAVFFKKELFKEYGMYDTSYRFCADLDLLLHIFKMEPKTFVHFNEFVCNYHEIGLSAKPENYEMIIEEKEKILKNYLSLDEYKNAKEQYLSGQTFKTKWRIFVSERPFLKNIIGKLYSNK